MAIAKGTQVNDCVYVNFDSLNEFSKTRNYIDTFTTIAIKIWLYRLESLIGGSWRTEFRKLF